MSFADEAVAWLTNAFVQETMRTPVRVAAHRARPAHRVAPGPAAG